MFINSIGFYTFKKLNAKNNVLHNQNGNVYASKPMPYDTVSFGKVSIVKNKKSHEVFDNYKPEIKDFFAIIKFPYTIKKSPKN